MSPEISEEYLSLEEWARIVAYAWDNEDFKNEFELHPRKAIEDLLDPKNVDAHNEANKRQLLQVFHKVSSKRFFEVPPRPRTITDIEIDDILGGKQKHIIPYLTV